MIIFRFNAAVTLVAKALTIAGLCGFLACVGYQIIVGRQLFGNDDYRTPAAGRIAQIELKGSHFFVDKQTAQRLNFSEDAALPIFLVGILAGLYLKRTERKEKSK